jgi:diguanylate cyclase (GGDEF)-like protein
MKASMYGDSHPGLMQRDAVLRRLDEELARSRREHADLSIGLLGLDGLERVNAGPGQETCDAVVGEMVRRVRGVLRPYDGFGRLAFDQFLVVLPRTGARDVAEVLNRLRQEIVTKPFSSGATDADVDVSLGGVTGQEETGEELVAQAYRALDEVRAQGRNSVVAAPRVELEAVIGGWKVA